MDCLNRPHFLLTSETSESIDPGRWRFVLRNADGGERLVADDIDPDARGDRLELLTVVRGLEALEQPSRVTLWTPSSYVREGIRYGVNEWRQNDWCWEYFGQMVPVKNDDLWKRLDRVMEFHQVDCRSWRVDPAHVQSSQPVTDALEDSVPADSAGVPDTEPKPPSLRVGGVLRRLRSSVQSILEQASDGKTTSDDTANWVAY